MKLVNLKFCVNHLFSFFLILCFVTRQGDLQRSVFFNTSSPNAAKTIENMYGGNTTEHTVRVSAEMMMMKQFSSREVVEHQFEDFVDSRSRLSYGTEIHELPAR